MTLSNPSLPLGPYYRGYRSPAVRLPAKPVTTFHNQIVRASPITIQQRPVQPREPMWLATLQPLRSGGALPATVDGSATSSVVDAAGLALLTSAESNSLLQPFVQADLGLMFYHYWFGGNLWSYSFNPTMH